MKVLVTGGTGFVGKNLVKTLLEKENEVLCPVRNLKKAESLKKWGAHIYKLDDLSNISRLQDLFDRVDLVVHLAGVVRAVKESDYIKTNALGTLAVAEAVLSSQKRPFLIYISSLAAAGPSRPDTPLTEEEYERPITPYGRSKFMGEIMLRAAFSRAQYMGFSILRPPVIFGPYDTDVFTYFKMAKRGILPLPGDGKSRISIVHVQDVVHAILLVASNRDRTRGETFFIDDNNDYSWKQICEIFRKQINPQAVELKIPIPASKMVALFGELYKALWNRPALLDSDKITEIKMEAWTSRSNKIRQKLNFENTVSLHKGIETTYRWYREAGWL